MASDDLTDFSGLADALSSRYQDPPMPASEDFSAHVQTLEQLARHGSVRTFRPDAISIETLTVLSAVALAAPTKSDLQQRDIVIVSDADKRQRLIDLVGGQAWVSGAPALLVFCGNHRRQRQLHDLRQHAFANDHLDAFFNAVVDAGIALATFVSAAESIGLGTCPISAVRNRAEDVSTLLELPDKVFPVAGLAAGWPAEPPSISPRLPLALTIHVDRFSDAGAHEQIQAYDAHREAVQPYASQRYTVDFGTAEHYGWSEDKARQYAKPERVDFGQFVRSKGFCLD